MPPVLHVPDMEDDPVTHQTDLPATGVIPATSPGVKRTMPILIMAVVALVGGYLLKDHLTFAALADNRADLIAFRDQNFLLAALAFVATYALIVAFSLPGATIATLTGGFLFGLFPGVLFNVVGATIGAVGVFLAARYGFGAAVAKGLAEKGGSVAKLQTGIKQNEWSVLFLMRLVPIVPFFLANLIPAFLNVPLYRFAVTTFFGIMPGAFVFTSIGSGLSEVFARGETPDLSVFFSPQVLGPILGLAALSALPIVIRAFRGKDL
jgi:uncharacterized membrane protein YdjX (TVP38/TMEM64 family)